MTDALINTKIVIAERRNATIGNLLKVNKLRLMTPSAGLWGSRPCRRPKCKACIKMVDATRINNRDGTWYQIRDSMNCESHYVIYCLTCLQCHMQYVGQTTNAFSTRLCGHRHNIMYGKSGNTPHVAPHFNTPGHDYICILLQKVPFLDKKSLNMAEALWIHSMNSVYPNGLNEYTPAGL